MKKLYTLLFILTSILTYSQGSINFDTDANWSATTPASYGNHTYTDGVFTASGIDVLRNGLSAQDGFTGGFGTYSVRLRNNGTTSLTMLVSTGGIGNFSFQARRWDGDPATNFAVETTIDNGTTWVASSSINATLTNNSDWKTVSGVINSANANVGVRIVSLGTTERIMVDNFTWTAPSSDPSLVITSPSNATIFNPSTTAVNIGLSVANFNVASGGTGDGYITYTVNGGTSVDKFDTTNIALTSLTPGMYTVVVNLVDNAGSALSTPVSKTVNFEIANYTNVATIAALRADVTANGLGKFYNLTGEAFVTYARATRNQKYIQDATAAVLIDDISGVITNTFVTGDGMTGLKAQTSAFTGLLQLNPLENITVSSSGTFITPEVVTAAALNANIEAYESELVQINGATFTTADGTITFASNTDYNLNDGSDIVFRTLFTEADYITQIIPQNAADRIVLVGRSNAIVKVTARNIADFNLSAPSFNAIDGLTMYPNPLTGNMLYFTSTANATMTVEIYDLLGKEILKANVVNNAVNVSKLTAGVYVVKVTEEGKTATRKLVIK